MRRALLALGLGGLAACAGGAQPAARPAPPAPPAGPWRPAPAPLLTRWAAEVSPENALPEYPRPQLVRPRWRSLNGLWEFAPAAEGEAPPLGRTLPRRILVPFAVESALSGVGERHERIWYRRTFRVPAEWRGERVLLHFGAVDWEAVVHVNGRELATHRGGYDGFTVDVTDALRPEGEQELVVGVYDPTDGGEQARGKQVEKPRTIWYTSVTGIWQTVWLEPVPAARVERLRLAPDVEGGALRLAAEVAGAAPGDTVLAVALSGGREVGRAAGAPGAGLRVPVPDARLWSPDDPFLYDLRVELRRGGRALDRVDSYFGMRSVALGPDSAGVRRILLNGRPFFGVGPLDQGYWPGGLYTAPTDEALRWDLEITKRLGFNTTRKHVKVEPARWYHHADRIGLVVWQDMPSGRPRTDEGRRQFETELREMVEELRNHPSIVMWVPFNEGWGQFDAPRIAAMVKEWDPGRLVNDASGWEHTGAGDVADVHRYQEPQALAPGLPRAAVVGEFGGLGYLARGHTWAGDGWGYAGNYATAEQLADRYEQLIQRLWRRRDSHGTSAGIYTQLTDIELEINGLLTYDREVLKVDTARLAAVNSGRAPHLLPELREFADSVVVSIAQGVPTGVRFTLDGSEPGPASPRYERPFVLRADAEVRARAFARGAPASHTVRAAFRRSRGRAATAVADAVPGVAYALFESTATRPLTRLTRSGPDSLAPVRAGATTTLDVAPAGGIGRFAVRYTGWLKVPRDGAYTLTVRADDGMRTWVGDTLLLDGMGIAPALTETSGAVALRAGHHPFALTYFQSGGPAALEVYVEGPGMPRQRIAPHLFRAPAAAASDR